MFIIISGNHSLLVFGETGKNVVTLEDWTPVVNLVIAIAGFSGVVGIFWGIYEYRETQKTKRKDILFELVKEFDRSEEMHFAKRILDGFIYNFPESLSLGTDYFSKSNLGRILRHHNDGEVTDAKEIELRDSFSALFDFFDKLGYLYSNNILKPKELTYFEYFIKRARKSPGVLDFVKNYDYRWNDELPQSEK